MTHRFMRIGANPLPYYEHWHAGLEAAATLYFGEQHDIEGMLRVLEGLHGWELRGEDLDGEEEVWGGIVFEKRFGGRGRLGGAWEMVGRYRESGELGELDKAWDVYYEVFREIARSLPGLRRRAEEWRRRWGV